MSCLVAASLRKEVKVRVDEGLAEKNRSLLDTDLSAQI